MEATPFIPYVIAILVAIGALFMIDAGGWLYGVGMAVFAFAVIFGLWAIKLHFDRIERSQKRQL